MNEQEGSHSHGSPKNGKNGRTLTLEEHLDNLVRHIELVRDAGLLLGKRLINQGEVDFGRLLIGRVFVHDASKFSGVEWRYLHSGAAIPKVELELAVKQHQETNEHHPEYWGGVSEMPALAVAEMVCDWYARSQEFGTGLRDWIEDTAIERFGINKDCHQYQLIQKFLDILLEDTFVQDQ
jgi:hypothetical protein